MHLAGDLSDAAALDYVERIEQSLVLLNEGKELANLFKINEAEDKRIAALTLVRDVLLLTGN